MTEAVKVNGEFLGMNIVAKILLILVLVPEELAGADLSVRLVQPKKVFIVVMRIQIALELGLRLMAEKLSANLTEKPANHTKLVAPASPVLAPPNNAMTKKIMMATAK